MRVFVEIIGRNNIEKEMIDIDILPMESIASLKAKYTN